MNFKIINKKRLIKALIKIFLIVIISTLIYMSFNHEHWNGINENDDKNLFNKLISRLYFTTTTLSSVGYGDISPKTNINRLITIILHIIVLITIIEYIVVEY